MNWKPSSTTDWITLTRNYSLKEGTIDYAGHFNNPSCRATWCMPLRIQFTEVGRQQTTKWMRGAQWGLRLYREGEDPGLIFAIKLRIENPLTVSIGPNRVLAGQGPPVESPVLIPAPTTMTTTVVTSEGSEPTWGFKTSAAPPEPSTGQRLINLVVGAF